MSYILFYLFDEFVVVFVETELSDAHARQNMNSIQDLKISSSIAFLILTQLLQGCLFLSAPAADSSLDYFFEIVLCKIEMFFQILIYFRKYLLGCICLC